MRPGFAALALAHAAAAAPPPAGGGRIKVASGLLAGLSVWPQLPQNRAPSATV
jgi:hypothetical protein